MRLRISRFINYCRKYGFRTAWGYIIMPFLYKRGGLSAKHQAVKRYLYRWGSKYVKFESTDLCVSYPKQTLGSSSIWICWLQGESQMPEVIQLCYKSVKRNAGDLSVRLLTLENIECYVTIPESISAKLASGALSYTHFSDYLRILILKTYGGLWLDASIFVSGPIDFDSHSDNLYTIKMPKLSDAYVSDYKWTVGLMGARRNNLLFSKLEVLMRKYVEDHDELIDFFLFDYLIAILYSNNSNIRQMIDNVPVNNEQFYHLEQIINNPCDISHCQLLLSSQIYHRLSWKANYSSYTDDALPTNYTYIKSLS